MLNRATDSCSLINARFVKPLDEEMLLAAVRDHRLIVTLEENVRNGEKIDIDINSTSYNYSSYAFSYDYISRNYTEKYYDKKDYESSAAIAAMQIAEQSRDFSTSQLLVLGANKSKSRTDQNEQSWDVYYQAY